MKLLTIAVLALALASSFGVAADRPIVIVYGNDLGYGDVSPRRGDAIAQLDWSVGEVLSTLDWLGLTAHPLVIFTSDNGPVVDDGDRDEAVEKLGLVADEGPDSRNVLAAQLYDVAADPGETKNLVASQRDVVKALGEALARERARTRR